MRKLSKKMPLIKIITTSLIVLIIAVVACLVLKTDTGEHQDAKNGYKAASPIIQYLEQYKRMNAVYPASISSLGQSALRFLGENGEYINFEYYVVGDNYELAFKYYTPRLNYCLTQGGNTGKWECVGHDCMLGGD